MNRYTTALAAACFALSATVAFAQAPQGEHRQHMSPEQREKMREHMKAAHETCKDSKDRRACMTGAMCAKAPDPAKCQAMAKERHARFSERMDERQKAHEACTGKRGEELGKCLREQPAFKDGHGRRHHPMKG
jgi:hypothetical protein